MIGGDDRTMKLVATARLRAIEDNAAIVRQAAASALRATTSLLRNG
jgi:hypothetical protein